MSFNDYKDPIVSQWHMSGGDKYSKTINNESHNVISSMFALVGLPDISSRVIINGYVEIDINSKITEPNQFKVDYTNGYVFVHPSKEGQSINVNRYASRGVNYYPASRVYTEIDKFGEIKGTVEDISNDIGNLKEVVGEIDGAILDAKETDRSLKEHITTAESERLSLDDSINEAYAINDTLGNDVNGTIKIATEKDVKLNDTIIIANQTQTDLDESVASGVEINDILSDPINGTIKTANDSNDDLKATTIIANDSNSSLDTSISTANESRQDLDDSIIRGNTINVKLANPIDGAIKVANDANDEIVRSTTIADRSKVSLDESIDTSKSSKTSLDASISEATTIKTSLDTSKNEANIIDQNLKDTTVLANNEKASLDTSIDSANDIDNKLSNDIDGSIKQATDKHLELNTSTGEASNINETLTNDVNGSIKQAKDSKQSIDDAIVNASSSKEALDISTNNANSINDVLSNNIDGTIKEANETKVKLDTSIDSATLQDESLGLKLQEANLTKDGLDTSIVNGEALKGELNGIIEGTDYQVILEDISNLTTNKADKTTATTLEDGLMSKEDKVKVDKVPSIEAELNMVGDIVDSTSVRVDGAESNIIALQGDSHTHSNKDTLDGLSDELGSLKYNGQDVGVGDMEKSVYDTNNNGKVDKAEDSDTVNGKTVESNVPANAKFTDTIVDISGKSDKAVKEVQSVLKGDNTLTIMNNIDSNDEIQIVDVKYGIKWFEGTHWNRLGQVVTFTSNMLDDMDFEIMNMG